MEETDKKIIQRKNGITKLLFMENITLTALDLSHRNITNIDSVELPPNLIEINLSNNKLECVPAPVLYLKCLKTLNLSHNNIKYFDETPEFYQTVEKLDLSYNDLLGPPYWVWTKNPKNLLQLDVSGNVTIKKSLDANYLNKLLLYKITLRTLKMQSCNINPQFQLLETLVNLRELDMSSKNLISANIINAIPFKGLDKCCYIETLNFRHTQLYTINHNISIFKDLTEINLAENYISNIPKEFCDLLNLKICILSYNAIMYLPDDIIRLKKLEVLCLDSNNLYMLPENIHELKNLIKLDVYNNYLYDAPVGVDKVQEIDYALNYFDEPDDEEYKEKKNRLRSKTEPRSDGRKYEILQPERESSRSDEDLSFNEDDSNTGENNEDVQNRNLSSPEDWDSDDFWVPHYPRHTMPPQSPWLFFVKRKMAEGNFCPIDLHAISIAEKVKYEKLCIPPSVQECEGQFDDCSSDDS